MSRFTFVLAAFVSLAGLSSGGCRSCSSCHDYDPPVAHCACGCTAPSGCNGCGCNGGGCDTCSSCGSGNCGCNQPSTAYAGPAPTSPGNMNPAYATKTPNNQQQRPNQSTMTNASQQ